MGWLHGDRHDRKVEKARNWFNRAVTLNPDIGDFWALAYKFECQHGTKEQQDDVLARATAGDTSTLLVKHSPPPVKLSRCR
jgi:uncharacterized protein HemY